MADKICFVISPIGEPESETRKRSDQVFNHVITPAVEQFKYEPLRADQIAEPGLISSQVIQHIVNDPLVIADLTGRNPNVFYELALRHALRSPLVQIIQAGEQIPFDVAGTRTIYVDHQDLDSVANAKEEIVKLVTAIEKKPADIETPISVSIDLQNLKKSDNPEQRSLGDLLSVVTEIRTGLANVEKRLDDQMNPSLAVAADVLHVLNRQTRTAYGVAHELLEAIDELRRHAQVELDDPVLSEHIRTVRSLASDVSLNIEEMREGLVEPSPSSRRSRPILPNIRTS